MHFNLAAGLEHLHSRCDHIYLLINLDFLDGLLRWELNFFVGEAVHEANFILLLFSKCHHFWIRFVDVVFLDRNVVFYEVLLRISYNLRNLLEPHLIQIVFPI